MEDFVLRMIEEHKELVARITKLNSWVYGGAHEKVDTAEFANECIQLKAMKIYEEALRARIINHGIVIADGDYLVSVEDCEFNNEKNSCNND